MVQTQTPFALDLQQLPSYSDGIVYPNGSHEAVNPLLQRDLLRHKMRHRYDTRETIQLRDHVIDMRIEIDVKLGMYAAGRRQVDLLCKRATESNVKASRRTQLRLDLKGEQIEGALDEMQTMRKEFEGAMPH